MAAPVRGSVLVAVAGATGYIGTRLVPRLLEAGYRVRCLVRSPRKIADRPWSSHPNVEIVSLDLEDEPKLKAALDRCHALYYLVHSMMSAGHDYAQRDRELAETVHRAAAAAGVERIIYLGGLGSQSSDRLSEHLASRREVERILAEGPVPLTAFRAAMIIGSGSASFEILRYLTERLPVMLTPLWVRTECQPIAVRNVLHYLVTCLEVPETSGRTLEIGGPDIVTYETLIQLMAELRGLPRRRIIPVPLFTPRVSALWIHLISPVDAAIAQPLAEGLRNRVVVTDPQAAGLMPQPLLGVREAIARALNAEARADVESTWTAAGPVRGDPDWAGGKVFEDRRELFVAASPQGVFDAVATLGGRRGWYRYNPLWITRGILDRLIGGPGWQRNRRHPTQLAWGDAVGFWRVAAIEPPRSLTLRAEMRVPGDAVLEFRIAASADADGKPGSTLVQTARFRPRGLLGLLYWYSVTPLHGPVFAGLIAGIADAALNPAPQSPLPSSDQFDGE
ncbi:MAG: SDR family oxidoreductase [Vicinamibacterales bacterium]